MKKLLVLAGGVVGYVLGTRAGRERYAQIKRGSSKLWNSPPVQAGVAEAESAAKQAAAATGDKVAEAASTLKDKVTSTAEPDDEPPVRPVAPEARQTGSAPQEGIS